MTDESFVSDPLGLLEVWQGSEWNKSMAYDCLAEISNFSVGWKGAEDSRYRCYIELEGLQQGI